MRRELNIGNGLGMGEVELKERRVLELAERCLDTAKIAAAQCGRAEKRKDELSRKLCIAIGLLTQSRHGIDDDWCTARDHFLGGGTT